MIKELYIKAASESIKKYKLTLYTIPLIGETLTDYQRIGELLKITLKTKFTKNYWHWEKEKSLNISITLNNDNLQIKRIRCKEDLYLSGHNGFNLFGVNEGITLVNDIIKSEKTIINPLETFPIDIFNSIEENYIKELKFLINKMNNYIDNEFMKIKDYKNNELYNKFYNIEKDFIESKSLPRDILNNNLNKFKIPQKTLDKMSLIFDKHIYEIYVEYPDVDYSKYSINIFAKTDWFIPDGLMLTKINNIYIGKLLYDYKKDTFKVEANIMNQKYFKAKNTAIQYIKTNLKKELFREEI